MIRFGKHQDEPGSSHTPETPESPKDVKTPNPGEASHCEQGSGETAPNGSSQQQRQPAHETSIKQSGIDPRRPGRRKSKRGGKWVVCTLMAMVLIVATAVFLVRRPPAVWREFAHLTTQTTPDQRQKTVADILAQIERDLKLDEHGSGIGIQPRIPGMTLASDPDSPFKELSDEQIAAIPFDQSTKITLSNHELNALTDQLFNDWILQRGFDPPAGLTPPLIAAKNGKLLIGFRISRGNWSQSFGGELLMDLQDDGRAHCSVQSFTVGSLPVPLHEVGVVLRAEINAEAANKIGNWVRKLENFNFRPVLELQHRRRARITAMKINADDTVTLTLRIQDHKTYRSHNTHMARGVLGPRDILPANPHESGESQRIEVADVPTIYD